MKRIALIAHSQSPRSFELPFGQGEDRPAKDLGLVGGADQAEHDHRHGKRGKIHVRKRKKAEVEEEKQHEQGDAPEKPNIDLDDRRTNCSRKPAPRPTALPGQAPGPSPPTRPPASQESPATGRGAHSRRRSDFRGMRLFGLFGTHEVPFITSDSNP